MQLIIGYILLYTGIIAILCYFLHPILMLPIIGSVLVIIGLFLIVYAPYRPRQDSPLRQQVENYWWYDWYYFLDIPFRFMLWLVKKLVSIFD